METSLSRYDMTTEKVYSMDGSWAVSTKALRAGLSIYLNGCIETRRFQSVSCGQRRRAWSSSSTSGVDQSLVHLSSVNAVLGPT